MQDVVLSSDGQFTLSGSWDGELRLWDLSSGASTRRFVGHSKDVAGGVEGGGGRWGRGRGGG